MANALNMTCTSQEICILCACKTRMFSFGVLQFADAFTNELIKWLHKIANNRLCKIFFLVQLIRTAIPMCVSSSLCVRTLLLF